MWAHACTAFLLISCVFSAPLTVCPEGCTCQPFGHRQEAFCSSLDFLEKPLSPKVVSSIVKLTVRNNSITSIDPRLKGLKNLKHLNLSSNRIKYFTASQVPKSVVVLDVSNNAISYIPSDWNSLPELRKINLSGNPLSCSCDALWSRDTLLSSYRITVEEPVVCASPKVDREKSWLKVKCGSDSEFLFGEMQGDEPVAEEGSGSGDDWAEPLITESPRISEDSDPIHEEFIKDNVDEVQAVTTTSESPQDVWEEGSGSDDFSFDGVGEVTTSQPHETSSSIIDEYDEYDDEIETETEEQTTVIPEEPELGIDLTKGFPVGCIINCSTPAPIEDTNDNESSPPPGLFEGVKIFVGDIFGGLSSTSTSEVPVTTSTTSKPAVSTDSGVKEEEEEVEEPEEVTVKEEVIKPTVYEGVESSPPKESPKKNVESVGKTDSIKEKDAVQAQESKQSSSTFIFLGVLLLVMICLIIYAVVRRTAAKKKGRHRSEVAGLDDKPAEEMKLIKSTTVENGKQNGKPETIPLINSQNGTKNHVDDDIDKERSSKKEPVTPPGTPAEEEEVELRQKQDDSLLTPETKRVTIRASEIPDSVPKTPILVTRHVDSDGKIVTTPNLSQRSAK